MLFEDLRDGLVPDFLSRYVVGAIRAVALRAAELPVGEAVAVQLEALCFLAVARFRFRLDRSGQVGVAAVRLVVAAGAAVQVILAARRVVLVVVAAAAVALLLVKLGLRALLVVLRLELKLRLDLGFWPHVAEHLVLEAAGRNSAIDMATGINARGWGASEVNFKQGPRAAKTPAAADIAHTDAVLTGAKRATVPAG